MSRSSIYLAKRPVTGEIVAVLDATFENRLLNLIPAQSRAVQNGEIHELMLVDKAVDVANHVIVLGFLEVISGGVILIGDQATLDGAPLGEVVGFDQTHMPNHMNILVKGPLRRTEMRLGSKVSFRKQ